MKRIVLMCAPVLIIAMLSSCGGGKSDCYECQQNAYFNGINTTPAGEWGVYCKKKGESDADFEERIEKKRSSYTCKTR